MIRTSCSIANGENCANGTSGNAINGGKGGSVYCASGLSTVIDSNGDSGGGGG